MAKLFYFFWPFLRRFLWPNRLIILSLNMFNQIITHTMNYQTFLDQLHAGNFVKLNKDNVRKIHVSYNAEADVESGIKAGYSFYDGMTLVAHSATKGGAIDTLDSAIRNGYTIRE